MNRTWGRAGSALAACAVALAAAAGAGALQAPGRTVVRAGQVQLVALDHASYAFEVSRSKRDCDHVEMWNTDTKGIWRFGRPGPCTNLGSTGAGISALGVSGNRALWVRYNGGNFRDWQLMTATTTQKMPRQIRFVEQDVENAVPPFLIGDSTSDLGIPYAAGKQVVLLGANGAAVFKHTEPARVVALAAGKGPRGAVVAVVLETGEVDMLERDGSLAWSIDYPPGAVKAIALAPAGMIAQLDDAVQIRTPTGIKSVHLPASAVMTDFAEGTILYRLGNTVHFLHAATGKDALVLKGAAKTPVVATLDTHGLAWGRGATANFACAGCISP